MQIRIRKHLRNLFWGTYEDLVNPMLKRVNRRWLCSERIFENAFCIGHIVTLNPQQIIDIGCSRSSIPLELATLGFNVTGVDLRDFFFEHPNLTFIRGDFTKIAFDKKFDLVTCISVFEHVGLGAYREPPDESKVAAFAEKMVSVITPGGHLILTLPLNTYQSGFINRYTLSDVKGYFSTLQIVNSSFFRFSNGIYLKVEHVKDEEVTACLVFRKVE